MIHIWQWGPNPLFYEDPLILSSPSFSNFVQPLPPFFVVSNPHPHWSFGCLVSLPEWVITSHLVCYFT